MSGPVIREEEISGVNADLLMEASSDHEGLNQRFGTDTSSNRMTYADYSQSVRSNALGNVAVASAPMFYRIRPSRQVSSEEWAEYNIVAREHTAGELHSFYRAKFLREGPKSTLDSQALNVRRPYYSGVIPRMGTVASICVMTSEGELLSLMKAPGGESKHFTDFTLVSWQHSPAERHQVTESFGTDYLKVFGRRAQYITFAGILIDSTDFNWKSVFLYNWDQTLRATRLVELDARAMLTTEDLVFEGYFLKMNVSKRGSNNRMVPFQAVFYAREVHITDPNIVAVTDAASLGSIIKSSSKQHREMALEGTKDGARAIMERLGSQRLSAIKKPKEGRRWKKGDPAYAEMGRGMENASVAYWTLREPGTAGAHTGQEVAFLMGGGDEMERVPDADQGEEYTATTGLGSRMEGHTIGANTGSTAAIGATNAQGRIDLFRDAATEVGDVAHDEPSGEVVPPPPDPVHDGIWDQATALAESS